MIDELVIGHTYTLENGCKMKVVRFIPKKENDRFDTEHYEIEANGKTFIHTADFLKRLRYREDKLK